MADVPPSFASRDSVDLSSLSARDLMRRVKETCVHGLTEAGNRVLTHFYYRYRDQVAWAAESKLGHDACVPEIVRDVFLGFWQKVKGEDYHVEEIASGPGGDRQVASYLKARAKWRAQNLLASRREFAADPNAMRDLPEVASPREIVSPYAHLRPQVTAWLASLDPQDHDLLDAYFFNNEGVNTDRVPNAVIQRLCTNLGVTPSALRHRKRKLLIRLTEYLQIHAHEKTSPSE